MKNYIQFVILLFICSCTIKDNEDLYEPVTLSEVKDHKGRLIKKVTAGKIPGEDVYLTISNYDTLGYVILEYGAKTYGHKFKTEYKYDSIGRITDEFQYDFNSDEFEHYTGERYTIKDTIADFSSNKISRKINYQYGNDSLVRERIYDLYIDSFDKSTEYQLSFDTTYDKRIE